MADKLPAKPAEPPKAVHIGGESIVDRLLPHVKKIVVGIIVIAVVLTIVFALRWVQERKQTRETEKLAEVINVGVEPIQPPGAGSGSDAKQPPNTFPDTKARAAAVLDAIAKQGTDAAGHAYRGAMLLDAGKTDEAITEYTKGQAEPGLEGVLCREGLGLATEAKAAAEKDPAARQKGYEAALAVFASMQPAEDGPRRAYALYHQARIQELLGKRADAKATFEKAKAVGKGSDLAELIEKRLAALGAS